jgi:hypothetical protein
MVVVPMAMPVTIPVVLIVAVVIALLLHVPPAVGWMSMVVRPAHTAGLPVILGAGGLTVTVLVAVQPVPVV